jgi:hypothetical protein
MIIQWKVALQTCSIIIYNVIWKFYHSKDMYSNCVWVTLIPTNQNRKLHSMKNYLRHILIVINLQLCKCWDKLFIVGLVCLKFYWIIQEYGITVEEKLHISQSICTPLMRKIHSDLHVGCLAMDEESTRLNSK